MSPRESARLIVLSALSCAGKSPLSQVSGQVLSGTAQQLQKLVLFNSSAPRRSATLAVRELLLEIPHELGKIGTSITKLGMFPLLRLEKNSNREHRGR